MRASYLSFALCKKRATHTHETTLGELCSSKAFAIPVSSTKKNLLTSTSCLFQRSRTSLFSRPLSSSSSHLLCNTFYLDCATKRNLKSTTTRHSTLQTKHQHYIIFYYQYPWFLLLYKEELDGVLKMILLELRIEATLPLLPLWLVDIPVLKVSQFERFYYFACLKWEKEDSLLDDLDDW